MSTIGGPRDVLTRFLNGENVAPREMLRDTSQWEYCSAATPEQAHRWDQLIRAMFVIGGAGDKEQQ